MMIDKRLIGTVSESRKFIAGNVACQWCSLAANIMMMIALTSLLAALYTDASAQVMPAVLTACLALPVRERAPAHGWLRDCWTSPAARFG